MKPQLLVVDDDEVHREMTSRLLRADYRLYEAETGDEALALMDRLCLQCVLLDNLLPDYTGIELLPMIAQRGLPVVMMTSLATEELIDKARAAGCEEILPKDGLTKDMIRRAIAAAAGPLPVS